MDIDIKELEMAVLYAYKQGPEHALMREQATRFCDTVRQSPTGWQPALDLLKGSSHAEVKFFALTTIQDSLGPRPGISSRLGPEEREVVRTALGPWLKGEVLQQQPPFVRTKLAVLMGLLVKRDYPERWPSAFQDLLGLAQQSPFMVEFLTRFLDAVDEDIVAFHIDRTKEEVDQNTNIKDHVRATSDMGDVVNFVIGVVRTWLDGAPGPGNQEVTAELAASSLSTLGKYVGWIDINLIANELVLGVLFESATNPREPQVAEAALGCLHELISKGMEEAGKIQLLQSLQLLGLLSKISMEDEDVAERVGQLVDRIGEELLGCWDGLEPHIMSQGTPQQPLAVTTAAMLKEVLVLALNCLSHDDIDVSGAMVPLLQRLLLTLKRQVSQGYQPPCEAAFSAVSHVPSLYSAVARRLPFDMQHKFDPNDEDEGEEEEHRKHLIKVFVNTTRITPELGLACVCEVMQQLTPPLSTLPWPQLEAALRLVFHFSEGCARNSTAKKSENPAHLVKEGAFPAVVQAIHNSDIRQHAHPQILLLYYNISIRYSKMILDTGQHLIPSILDALAGTSGLAHPTDAHLRARSCYFLLKLVKALNTAMAPFVGTVARGIQDLLENPELQATLGPADLLNLYQALGCLVGLPSVKVQEQKEYLEIILTRQIAFIHDLMKSPFLQTDKAMEIAEQISHHIAAMGHISQGIRQAKPELAPIFSQVLEVALAALNLLPTFPLVRQKTSFLLHRMVICLGVALVDLLPGPLLALIMHCSDDDLPQVTSLINDLMINFKEQLLPVLDPLFLRIVEKIFHTANLKKQRNSGPIVAPHELVEQEALTRTFFSVVLHLVTHGLTDVLLSPTNAPHLENLLQTILHGLGQNEPVIKKHAIGIFAMLLNGVKQAKDAPVASGIPDLYTSIMAFISEVAFPTCLKTVIVNPDFNLDDANSLGVLVKLSEFLLVLKSVHGANFISYLCNQMVSSIQCPPNVAQEFSETIDKGSDSNEIAGAVKTFAALARQ